MQRLIGIPVSPGVAVGRAALLLQHPFALRYSVSATQVPGEIDRLEQAREQTSRQLDDIRARVAVSAGAELAQLFEAQLLMLDDRLLVPRARDLVARERMNAEWALQRAFDEVCALFAGVGDDYLRERRGDVADVVGRLHRNLHGAGGRRRDVLVDLDAGSVLVADDLLPSQAGQLDRRRVAGLVIETGSRTHHSAILARSLAIPAVAGVSLATALIKPGELLLIDGTSGELLIEPPPDIIESALARARSARPAAAPGRQPLPEPALTADGVPIRLEANVELPSEADAAKAAGAQGIGLFRSEFLLGGDPVEDLDEDRQYTIYRDLVERMAPMPVTIRTFDLDEAQAAGSTGDGRAEGSAADVSRGPLGMRAIRLSLNRRDVFAVQLRALVRAARHGPVRILFPFVTSVDELRDARTLLRSIEAEVSARDGLSPDIPVGAMIEVPSAALTVDLLADEADFFSIGTNDLVQYCLAVDRTDGRMASLYEPLHPAVLRVLRLIMTGARARGRAVSVCGEMAAEPSSLAVLLGLGVTTLSMAPASIPAARRLIRQITLRDVRRLAHEAIRLRTGRDVAALIAEALHRLDGGTGPASGGGGENGE